MLCGQKKACQYDSNIAVFDCSLMAMVTLYILEYQKRSSTSTLPDLAKNKRRYVASNVTLLSHRTAKNRTVLSPTKVVFTQPGSLPCGGTSVEHSGNIHPLLVSGIYIHVPVCVYCALLKCIENK